MKNESYSLMWYKWHCKKFSYFKDAKTNNSNCFINDKIYQFKIKNSKFTSEQIGEDSNLDLNNSIAPMPGLLIK